MAHSSGIVFSMVVVMVALFGGASAQTTHVVLDNTGWTIPQGGAGVYANWAASKTFMVGDTLVFNFASGRHDVAQVTKAAFDACAATNTIGSVLLNGPVNVTLNMAGEQYYICTFSEHCSLGQKLAINVGGSSSTAPRASPAPTGGPAVPCPPDATTPSTGPTAFVPSTPNSASVVATANFLLMFGSLSVILLSFAATNIL